MEADAALALSCMLADHGWPVQLPTGRLTPGQIWTAPDSILAPLLKITPVQAAKLAEFRRCFDPAPVRRQMRKKGITMLALGEEGYPRTLTGLHDPPPALFIRGDPDLLGRLMERPRVAIVGARRASTYGLDAARLLGEGLSRGGVCVVSGMAMGIDAAAHEGSLRYGGGSIAVLGCGADIVYPRANSSLYRRLIEHGAIVSEYPPGAAPISWRFPARNRIIAGLSEGVVVVEAREKSGALITADFCLEQGREVWALPGSIFSELSIGPHRLLRMGACLVSSPVDILEDLGIERPVAASQTAASDPEGSPGRTAGAASTDRPPWLDAPQKLTPDEKLVLGVLDARPRHQDILAGKAGLSGARTAAALISLELRGLARRDPARGYSR